MLSTDLFAVGNILQVFYRFKFQKRDCLRYVLPCFNRIFKQVKLDFDLVITSRFMMFGKELVHISGVKHI